MALKIYELITVSIIDGDLSVETSLHNYKKDLVDAFAAKTVNTIKELKEEYGDDAVVNEETATEEELAWSAIQYVIDLDTLSFNCWNGDEPGEKEIHISVSEHEI